MSTDLLVKAEQLALEGGLREAAALLSGLDFDALEQADDWERGLDILLQAGEFSRVRTECSRYSNRFGRAPETITPTDIDRAARSSEGLGTAGQTIHVRQQRLQDRKFGVDLPLMGDKWKAITVSPSGISMTRRTSVEEIDWRDIERIDLLQRRTRAYPYGDYSPATRVKRTLCIKTSSGHEIKVDVSQGGQYAYPDRLLEGVGRFARVNELPIEPEPSVWIFWLRQLAIVACVPAIAVGIYAVVT